MKHVLDHLARAIARDWPPAARERLLAELSSRAPNRPQTPAADPTRDPRSPPPPADAPRGRRTALRGTLETTP